jgi:Ca2+-binding RTX toxin-like protein
MVARAGRALGIAALCCVALTPVPANAAEIDRSDPYLTYEASPGEVNALTVTVRDGQVQFSDPAVKVDNLHGGAECTGVDTGILTCKLPAGMRVKVTLGDRDDSVELAAGVARLEGDDGADTLVGGPGADALSGGPGDDLLRGRGGTDTFEPGDGFDSIDYFDHTAPVVASFDGVANDGAAGENELVPADAEMLIGGQGPDRLTAAPAGSYLQGSPGNDTIYGGAGPDTLYGGKDADMLNGGGGVDRFFGDLGSDAVYAADGNPETVVCGDDFDYFRADALDTRIGCEQPGDPPDGTTGDPPAGGGSAGFGLGGAPPPPPPDLGRTVTVEPAGGKVTVRPPGGATVELGAGDTVPLGSIVDTTRGAVDLTSAADADGGTQTANFRGGVFRVQQTGGAKPVTELVLKGAVTCATERRGRVVAAGRRKGRSRRLWGSGHGNFRTRGRHASATVRGTIWLTEDRCGGTYTRVKRGVVAVKDLATGKTKLVRAGKSYLARPRR